MVGGHHGHLFCPEISFLYISGSGSWEEILIASLNMWEKRPAKRKLSPCPSDYHKSSDVEHLCLHSISEFPSRGLCRKWCEAPGRQGLREGSGASQVPCDRCVLIVPVISLPFNIPQRSQAPLIPSWTQLLEWFHATWLNSQRYSPWKQAAWCPSWSRKGSGRQRAKSHRLGPLALHWINQKQITHSSHSL